MKAPFCRVKGVIEREIGFELWLPGRAEWNGKFLAAGVGGDAGTFNFNDLPRGLLRGYAAATTDTGHKAAEVNWMLGDPMRLKNYELRAQHLLAETSKALIARYYDSAPRYSYFIGCSGGGRQGLKEMQRFAGDYNGIIAGAPGPKTPEMTVRRMWEIIQRDSNKGLMSSSDWKLVADAGVKACDAADGVTDGVVEDPRVCHFDIASLQCKAGQTQGCLSGQQIKFAKSFYDPLRDDEGRAIDDGLLPGVLVDSGRSRLAPATFGQAIRHEADWQGAGFDVSKDLAAIDKVMPELRADDADLTAFKARKGKAILYQGWMDPAVAAKMTIEYYEDVQKKMGGERATADFIRLFLAPGMLHCSGGAGPDQFGGSGRDAPIPDKNHDLLSALENWVERGQAPDRIIASKVVDGKVVRTRPLCAYPEVARYRGTGSTDDETNFLCVRPKRIE
ncbi:MAG: tannase/feruloyl esterase family alpha/beta hydrolase [Acetobacteraceae bacterium]|nr:tannase/feruloyl esterase family alpha/beta hydrolase [Acetobacteraceae bacterium]